MVARRTDTLLVSTVMPLPCPTLSVIPAGSVPPPVRPVPALTDIDGMSDVDSARNDGVPLDPVGDARKAFCERTGSV